jgi:hypothetical protein
MNSFCGFLRKLELGCLPIFNAFRASQENKDSKVPDGMRNLTRDYFLCKHFTRVYVSPGVEV